MHFSIFLFGFPFQVELERCGVVEKQRWAGELFSLENVWRTQQDNQEELELAFNATIQLLKIIIY